MALTINIPQTKSALTGIPLIADKKWALFEFKGYEEKPGDKGVTGQFRWELVNAAPSNHGTPIEPGKLGSKFFDSVRFYDKNTPQGQIPDMAVVAVSKRIDACLGTADAGNTKGKAERPAFDESTIAAMVGKRAWLKLKISEFEGNQKNEIVDARPENEPPQGGQ